MPNRFLLLAHPEPRTQTVTTFWHGNIAAATWTERNVSSVTENGVADVTLTFREVYQATPAVLMGGGVATNLNGNVHTVTASSARVITLDSSATPTVGRKSSVMCVGLI